MVISKKGDVPTPYIIALVLGVIVLALIAYWLFFSGGQFGSAIMEKGCEAKKMAYCSEWKTTGSQPSSGKFSTACTSLTETNKKDYYAPECCTLDWAKDDLSQAECGIS